jgi:predicted PurR-regulated permease PerM
MSENDQENNEIHPTLHDQSWTFWRVAWATLVLVLVVISFFLLHRFYQVLFILLIGILLGTAIRPVVTWLKNLGLPPTTGVILVYLLLLAFLISFILLIFPVIIEQGAAIVAEIPVYLRNLHEWMSNNSNKIFVGLSEFLPTTIPGLEPLQQNDQQMLATAGQAFGYVTLAAVGIFIAAAILVIAFHWTLEGRRTIQSFLQLFPSGQRESISEMISAMETKVGYYIVGQGVLCVIIGVMALITYLLIGLPNALLLAVAAGVLEAVPMIGPLLGAIPAAVIALSISPGKMVWVIIATLIIQQVENSVLVPRIMRKAVGINPFVSLLSIFAFSSLFGIAGALMAIPMTAIIQLLFDRFVFNTVAMESEISDGRNYASRLRYEAQYLAKDLRKQSRLLKWGTDQRLKKIDKVMDEIEAITTDLDALLAEIHPSDIL